MSPISPPPPHWHSVLRWLPLLPCCLVARYDKFCPFYKSVWMLRNIMLFHQLATQAVERAAGGDGQKITYNIIKQRLGDLVYKVA